MVKSIQLPILPNEWKKQKNYNTDVSDKCKGRNKQACQKCKCLVIIKWTLNVN